MEPGSGDGGPSGEVGGGEGKEFHESGVKARKGGPKYSQESRLPLAVVFACREFDEFVQRTLAKALENGGLRLVGGKSGEALFVMLGKISGEVGWVVVIDDPGERMCFLPSIEGIEPELLIRACDLPGMFVKASMGGVPVFAAGSVADEMMDLVLGNGISNLSKELRGVVLGCLQNAVFIFRIAVIQEGKRRNVQKCGRFVHLPFTNLSKIIVGRDLPALTALTSCEKEEVHGHLALPEFVDEAGAENLVVGMGQENEDRFLKTSDIKLLGFAREGVTERA
jgi:hypothetical protein